MEGFVTLDARFQIQRSPVSSEALSELIKQSKASTLAPMVEYVRKGIRKFGCNYTPAKVIQLLQEQSPFLKKEVKSLLEHAITNASNPLAKSDSKKKVKTGDNGTIWGYVLLLVSSMMCFVILFYENQKRRKGEIQDEAE